MAQLQHHLERRQRQHQRQDLRDPLTVSAGGERGAGLIGTVLGLCVLLATLAIVANVLVDLAWRARVEDVTNAALAEVASSGATDGELAAVAERAAQRARDLLGPRGADAVFRFTWTVEQVQVEVAAPTFTVLRLPGGGDAIERRAALHREVPG